MAWHARLDMRYSSANLSGDTHTQLHFGHDGPLRILKSLYPEGPGICHNVLVHPPGGLVGGDTIDIHVEVEAGAHGLVSTPGATRFYKTTTDKAEQRVKLRLHDRSRLEWLPLETIAYPGCWALNSLSFELAPTAQLMAWDVVALGLPLANEAFDNPNLPRESVFEQQLSWPNHWHERAKISGSDDRLLNSNVGFNGHRCMGTLVLVHGQSFGRELREHLQDSLRASWVSEPDAHLCGVTQSADGLLVVRVLGSVAEPVMNRLKTCWALLRRQAWGIANAAPRIWSV